MRNDPEFITPTINDWSKMSNINWYYEQLGKLNENSFVNQFSGSNRKDVSINYFFEKTGNARNQTPIRKNDYNYYQLYDSLKKSTLMNILF